MGFGSGCGGGGTYFDGSFILFSSFLAWGSVVEDVLDNNKKGLLDNSNPVILG